MMTVSEIAQLFYSQLTVGHVLVAWWLWMGVPMVLGIAFEWILAHDDVTAQDVRDASAVEWRALCEAEWSVRWVAAVDVALGSLGAGFRLTLWPLWFPFLWLRVESAVRPGGSPW